MTTTVDPKQQWMLPAPWNHTIVDIAIRPDEAKRSGAPSSWQALVGPGAVERVRAWWDARSLPAFDEYLRRELDDIAIGTTTGHECHVLLYRFRDWEEDFNGFLPGVMIAGAPALAQLDALEVAHGRLPDSLRAVWSRHAFAHLKNGSMLVRPSEVRHFETHDREYLAFVDSWSDVTGCLRRARGESAWSDEVVAFFPGEGTEHGSVSQTVDELLVDWATRKWPPGD